MRQTQRDRELFNKNSWIGSCKIVGRATPQGPKANNADGNGVLLGADFIAQIIDVLSKNIFVLSMITTGDSYSDATLGAVGDPPDGEPTNVSFTEKTEIVVGYWPGYIFDFTIKSYSSSTIGSQGAVLNILSINGAISSYEYKVSSLFSIKIDQTTGDWSIKTTSGGVTTETSMSAAKVGGFFSSFDMNTKSGYEFIIEPHWNNVYEISRYAIFPIPYGLPALLFAL
jgi:hypothetical protein